MVHGVLKFTQMVYEVDKQIILNYKIELEFDMKKMVLDLYKVAIVRFAC